KDVFSTYGPLGFITFPQDIGWNLPIAHGIQIGMWLILLLLGVYMIRRERINSYRLLLFAFPLTFGFLETKLQIWVLLCCVFLSLVVERWYFPYGLSVLLTSLLWFIKFNDAFLGLALIIGIDFVFLFYNRKRATEAMVIMMVGIPFVFITAYLIYNPSLSDMVKYLQGAWAVSAQYSVASSLSGRRIEIILAMLEMIVYTFLAWVFYQQRNKTYIIFIAFIPSLFMAFKSGFVRQDGHVLQFFSYLLLILTFIFLHAETDLVNKWGLASIGLLTLALAMVILPFYRPVRPDALLNAVTRMEKLVDYYQTRSIAYFEQTPLIQRIPEGVIEAAQVSPRFKELIGSHSVTIFPMEIMYAPVNNLNYYPSPTIQGYIAASPYLDLLNAAFFEDGNKSPEFIILGWESVDGRHVLMDTPATWLSIYRWYDWQDGNDKIAILKRRAQPRFTDITVTQTQVYETGDVITLPVQDTLLGAKISSMELSQWGQIVNLFFRIPEVRIHFQKEMGAELGYRVIPTTLSGGILLDQIPQTFQDAQLMLQGQTIEKIQSIVLSGSGLKYYKKQIQVIYYTIPDVVLKDIVYPPRVYGYSGQADRVTAKEPIEGVSALLLGKRNPPVLDQITVTEGELTKPAIFAHPPSDISWRLSLPAKSCVTFRTSLGFRPDVFEQIGGGDGVTFSVYIDLPGDGSHQIFSQYTNPFIRSQERLSTPISLNLSKYAGQEITLRLDTACGPANDCSNDWAVWIDPELQVMPVYCN
ncbi:MAG TPA: hypothetical protein VFR47_04820, partial [Anaerolineales bacterium]|nr:hypothetical protein [Anaerolineales bacterium]